MGTDMDDGQTKNDLDELDPETLARRSFLKKIGIAGAAAPAVALLMTANMKAAEAQTYGTGGGSGTGSS
jgi:hypothetical protein